MRGKRIPAGIHFPVVYIRLRIRFPSAYSAGTVMQARDWNREGYRGRSLVRLALSREETLPPKSGRERVVSGRRRPGRSALKALHQRLALRQRSSRVDGLLTIGQVARELGVSGPWVHARIRAGELRAIRGIGRGYRVRREWLDAFLCTREVCGSRLSLDTNTNGATVRAGLPGARGRAEPFVSAAQARAALVRAQGRRL